MFKLRTCPKCGHHPYVVPGINLRKGNGWCVWHPSCHGTVSAKFKWLAILRWNRWCKKPQADDIGTTPLFIEAAANIVSEAPYTEIVRVYTEHMEAINRRDPDAYKYWLR